MQFGGFASGKRTCGLALVCVGLSLGSTWACSAAAPAPSRAVGEAKAQYHGLLTDLVPAAGLNWMVVVRPKELLEDDTLRRGLERLVPDARLNLFARNSGVDLRTLQSGLVADFGLGTLYLAEGVDVEAARSAFLARLASEPLLKRLGPGVTHVTGLIGTTPQSFVGVSERIVGVSVKDPTLTKIAGAFALKKLQKSPTALAGAALRGLPASLATSPLRFYLPGPFADEWMRGAQGLFRDTVALAVTARIKSPGWLEVVVLLNGEYASDPEQSIQRTLGTFRELAQSALGRLLSLDDPSVVPEIVATPSDITLRAQLPLERLLAGLYAAVAANGWDLLDYQPRPDPMPVR